MSRAARALRAVPLLLLLGPAGTSAAESEHRPHDFEEAILNSGLSVGFGMLRLGREPIPQSLPLAGHVVGRTNSLVRFVVDESTGAAFGYRLEATAISAGINAYRVDIRPLGAPDEKELKRITVCPSCPMPRLVGSGPTRFPPTQLVRSGDTMVIDLLVRPETGEKIVDILKFSAMTVSRAVLDEVRNRLSGAFRHVRQGDEHVTRGALDAAAIEYRKALALQPDAATHARLGACYQRLERLGPALREYDQAVQLNSTDAEVWHNRSVLLHRRGNFGKAVSGYRQALKLRPDWAVARRNLATAHLDRADANQAFEDYREAHRVSPGILDSKDPTCVKAQDLAMQYYVFAKVHAAEGEIDAALESLRRAKASGFTDMERVHEEDEFKPLLQDPRLVALARGPLS